MKKRRFHPKTMTAVTVYLTVGVLILWLVGMYCVTAAFAEASASDKIEHGLTEADDLYLAYVERWEDIEVEDPNFWESSFWHAADQWGKRNSTSTGSGGPGFLARVNAPVYRYNVTAAYDASGNLLAGSWEDYLYLRYMSEEAWKAGVDNLYTGYAKVPFDRDKLTEHGAELLGSQRGSLMPDIRGMRLTGSFDGRELIPVKLEYISAEDYSEAVKMTGEGHSISYVVEKNALPWTVIYEDTEAVAADGELTTIYTEYPEVCWREDTPPITSGGVRYDSLAHYVQTVGPGLALSDEFQHSRYNGSYLLLSDVAYQERVDATGQVVMSNMLSRGATLQAYIVTVSWYSPWLTAMGELSLVYAGTLVAALAIIVLLRRFLRRHLVEPVATYTRALEEIRYTPYEEDELYLRDVQELGWNYRAARDRFQKISGENTRLTTALDYAKTAEENRRQMVSHIAHELKTPLAVVHGYAEGLQEHIAEDKRDKYLEIILSEAERMDGMVLEMLDLSRLEAGRIKLTKEEFDLATMVESTFERLSLAAEGKDLQIQLDLPEQCTVLADEGRMAQVVENLAANAIRYAPVGGWVQVRVTRDRSGTCLAISNASLPFTEEQLGKVWDSFYRADESRSSKGTGLGLAIVRSIVELHGGRCSVRNVKGGVEFTVVLR